MSTVPDHADRGDDDPILDAREAATYLNVSLDYVRRVIRYEVPVIQRHQRGRLRFRRSALDRWVTDHTSRPVR